MEEKKQQEAAVRAEPFGPGSIYVREGSPKGMAVSKSMGVTESGTLDVMGNKMDACLLGCTTSCAFCFCGVICYVLYFLRKNVVTTTVMWFCHLVTLR